MGFVVKVLTQL